MKQPGRGEVWLVDLGMAAKVRPCLVVSTRISNADRAIITLVPHTTATRDSAFEVNVGAQFLKPGAFNVQGIVTVPINRAIRLLGRLQTEQMHAVEDGLCRWLGLPCGQ